MPLTFDELVHDSSIDQLSDRRRIGGLNKGKNRMNAELVLCQNFVLFLFSICDLKGMHLAGNNN